MWALVCAYSPLVVDFDLYTKALPRSEYRHSILTLLAQSVKKNTLPPNPASVADLPVNKTLPFVKSVCSQMRDAGPYAKQAGFLQWEHFPISKLKQSPWPYLTFPLSFLIYSPPKQPFPFLFSPFILITIHCLFFLISFSRISIVKIALLFHSFVLMDMCVFMREWGEM